MISWVSIALLCVMVSSRSPTSWRFRSVPWWRPPRCSVPRSVSARNAWSRTCCRGFFIITEKQYGFGDLVQLTIGRADDAEGTVEDVTLRVTKLRSTEGEMFTIPNGQIVKSINLSKDWARAVVDIPVPTTADLNQVNEVLHGVATPRWTTDA